MAVTSLAEGYCLIAVRYGSKGKPDIPNALELCAAQGVAFDMMETSFFLGRETLIFRLGSEMALWREKLFIAPVSDPTLRAAPAPASAS